MNGVQRVEQIPVRAAAVHGVLTLYARWCAGPQGSACVGVRKGRKQVCAGLCAQGGAQGSLHARARAQPREAKKGFF